MLTRRAFLKLAAFGMVAGAAACAPAPDWPAFSWISHTKPSSTPVPAADLSVGTVDPIEIEMLSTLNSYRRPGLALGVIKDSRLVFAKGYGVAERGTSRPVTPQS